MIKQGKVWGETLQIISNESFEVHRIEIKANSFCSMHKHKHKFNGFFVESGTLEIIVRKNSYDLTDVTVLEPQTFTMVPPGEFHQFRAVTDCVVYEIYWAPSLTGDDIERESVGGVQE